MASLSCLASLGDARHSLYFLEKKGTLFGKVLNVKKKLSWCSKSHKARTANVKMNGNGEKEKLSIDNCSLSRLKRLHFEELPSPFSC